MGKVQVLDEATINRIAAGEVVDRPASAVKELLENSLDAGATRIEIEIERGGKSLIRVVDDGGGMTREDALLALERHATSKIVPGDSLTEISTHGFRGEALPAMAGVGRMTLKTRPRGSEEGTSIRIDGGVIRSVESVGGPEGTSVSLADLYFNTPARRKFLKGDGAERSAVTEVVMNAVLAWPSVSFRMIAGGETVLISPGNGSRSDLARQLFALDQHAQLVEFQRTLPGLPYTLSGLLGQPPLTLPTRRGIRLFVNGRPIRSAALSRSVLMAYKNFLPVGRAPLAVLFLDAPPSTVDVNVHPAKLEVRLQEASRLEDTLVEEVRSVLRECTGQPVPGASRPLGRQGESPAAQVRTPDLGLVESCSDSLQPGYEPANEGARPGGGNPWPREPSGDDRCEALPGLGAGTIPNERDTRSIGSRGGYPSQARLFDAARLGAGVLREGNRTVDWDSIQIMGQLAKTYILGVSEDTLFLIDQHVAHERILFEKALDRLSWENVPVQRLLVPITVELPKDAEGRVAEGLELLSRYGFEAQLYSAGTVVVTTIPHLSDRLKPEPLLKDLLADIEALSPCFSAEEALRAVAARMACRSAIMAGETLDETSMANLVGDLARTHSPMTCPHGRPSLVTLSVKDLERRFLRC